MHFLNAISRLVRSGVGTRQSLQKLGGVVFAVAITSCNQDKLQNMVMIICHFIAFFSLLFCWTKQNHNSAQRTPWLSTCPGGPTIPLRKMRELFVAMAKTWNPEKPFEHAQNASSFFIKVGDSQNYHTAEMLDGRQRKQFHFTGNSMYEWDQMNMKLNRENRYVLLLLTRHEPISAVSQIKGKFADCMLTWETTG